MRRVFFMILATVFATGCATGLGGYGISVPGYEAAGVVAGNQALIASIAGQQGWVPYGQPYGQYGYGNIPVCRARDLAGVPPVSQPVIVRVSKSKGHRTADILGGAMVGGGLGYLSGGNAKAAGAGAGIGAGGGLLVANHEQDLCLLLPAVKAP